MTVNIPSQFDPVLTTPPAMITHFDSAAEKAVAVETKKAADHQAESIINLSKSGLARDAGVMATGAGQSIIATRDEAAKKDQRKAKERSELMQYLSLIDQEIAYFDNQIKQANAALGAQGELEDLHQQGRLDPDNPDHADIFARAGLDPEEYRNDPDGSLSRNRERVEDWRDDATLGRNDAQRRRDMDYSNVSEAEILAETDTLRAAQSVRGTANQYTDADRAVDRMSAQIERADLSIEIDRQDGFSTEQASIAASTMSDASLQVSTHTAKSASFASAWGASGIDTELDPMGDFNRAAPDAELSQEADLTIDQSGPKRPDTEAPTFGEPS